MHLDQVVNVHCTDTDKENKGRVVRMHPKGIDVAGMKRREKQKNDKIIDIANSNQK